VNVIRKATEDDLQIVAHELAPRLQARLDNAAKTEIHMPTMFYIMRHFVVAQDKFFVVAEHENHLHGFLMAGVESFWWVDQQRGRRYVSDWAFYSEVRGDGVLMLNALKEWAWLQPRVIEVVLATETYKGRGVVERMFKGAGFEHVGGKFKVSRPEA